MLLEKIESAWRICFYESLEICFQIRTFFYSFYKIPPKFGYSFLDNSCKAYSHAKNMLAAIHVQRLLNFLQLFKVKTVMKHAKLS